MNDWNTDLNEAPKDGTELLVRYTKQSNVSKIVSWNKIHKHWQSKGEYVAGLASQSIVWMILPQYRGQDKWTVYCSSCGGEFKHTEKTGFSHCENHEGIPRHD